MCVAYKLILDVQTTYVVTVLFDHSYQLAGIMNNAFSQSNCKMTTSCIKSGKNGGKNDVSYTIEYSLVLEVCNSQNGSKC